MPILTTVGVFVGSLRKASFNRKIASPLMGLAPETLSFEIVEIGDLPIYNQDLDDEGAPPAAWQAFRAEVAPIDAVLCVTPKYNRSVPAVLKNALDAGSRPCWFAPVWTERLERQTAPSSQPRRVDWEVLAPTIPPAIAGGPQCSDPSAARSLSWWSDEHPQRGRRDRERRDA
jgi:hypothetical protein